MYKLGEFRKFIPYTLYKQWEGQFIHNQIADLTTLEFPKEEFNAEKGKLQHTSRQ